MPEWDGLLPPVSCGDRPIIDGVRTPVAYSSTNSYYAVNIQATLVAQNYVQIHFTQILTCKYT